MGTIMMRRMTTGEPAAAAIPDGETVRAIEAKVAGRSGGADREAGLMAEGANSDKWSRVKQRLRTELGEDVFNSWFGRVAFEQEDKSTVYLSVPTRFLKSWIMSHYYERLLVLWKAERSEVVRIEVIVRGAVRAKAAQPREGEAREATPPASQATCR